MPKKRFESRHIKESITRWRMYGVAAFAIIMVLGGVIGLIPFRPSTSEVENRNLTAFPALSVESFLDGSFFTDVSLWYADTYPTREPMVSADRAFNTTFGIAGGTSMYGGNVVADAVPGAGEEGETREPPAAAPEEYEVNAAIENNIMEGLYVKDGAAYSIFYFSKYAADTYVAALNYAAEELDGQATVYSILSPANSITLDTEEALGVGGSDQQETMNYLHTRFDERIRSIELVDDIIEHRDEYLYFRTDHHWTQLGAHYAYEAFCKAKGIEPTPLSAMREVDLGIFEGSYYATITSSGTKANSDTLVAHIPNGTNELRYFTESGETTAPVVDEKAVEWGYRSKYDAFISGDEALEIINNPKVTDGSKCLVVKDSYGCAFVPNLVDNYQTIFVTDFRENHENICQFAKENKVQDVIFVTGVKVSLSDTAADLLYVRIAGENSADSKSSESAAATEDAPSDEQGEQGE